MTDFIINGTAGINLADTYASASAEANGTAGKRLPMTPGAIVDGTYGSRYILVKASSTIAQYDAVVIIQEGSASDGVIGAVPVTTTNALTSQRLGVAQTAITSSEYGWIAVQGNNLRVNTLIACQPSVPLYTTSTAGKLDDTTVTAGYCLGIVILSSATSASAPPCILGHGVIRTYAGG